MKLTYAEMQPVIIIFLNVGMYVTRLFSFALNTCLPRCFGVFVITVLEKSVSNFAGLANPAPIIQTFYAEDQIFNDVKLDGVVTLVDAKHAGFHLDEIKPKGVVNEAVEQIAYADRIIVNKVHIISIVFVVLLFF